MSCIRFLCPRKRHAQTANSYSQSKMTKSDGKPSAKIAMKKETIENALFATGISPLEAKSGQRYVPLAGSTKDPKPTPHAPSALPTNKPICAERSETPRARSASKKLWHLSQPNPCPPLPPPPIDIPRPRQGMSTRTSRGNLSPSNVHQVR